MLTGYDHGDYVKTALSEGAAGYLLKDATPEDLAQAIHVALSGSGNVLSPRAVRNLFEGAGQTQEHQVRDSPIQNAGLTRRESDVLQLLSKGHMIVENLKSHWYFTGDEEIQRETQVFVQAGSELGYM